MNDEQINRFGNLLYRIGDDGLDYALTGYSQWSEIDDPEFHRLRRQYQRAAQQMKSYLDSIRSEYGIKS